MKIGVVTFWWTCDNYGQLLQAYGLQLVLREMGHEPFIIKYDRRRDVDHSLKARLHTLKDILLLRCSIKTVFNRKNEFTENDLRKFSMFRDRYLNFSKLYTTYEELKTDPPLADVYIVGSDQVWHFPSRLFYKLKNWANVYFLNFGSESIKRISYAASFSLDDISTDFCKFITPLLKRFSLVTVRETSGISICKKCLVKFPLLALDPTLLLTSNQWRSLASDISYPSNMLLCYLLANQCTISFDEVYNFSLKYGWNIKYIASQGQKATYDAITPSIEEFLSLVSSARFVVTNSFHGTVFSIIFNIPFLVIPLCGEFQSMNDRIFTLLKIFQLEDRIYSTTEDLYNQLQMNIKWESVNNILSERRREMLDLLDTHINS